MILCARTYVEITWTEQETRSENMWKVSVHHYSQNNKIFLLSNKADTFLFCYFCYFLLFILRNSRGAQRYVGIFAFSDADWLGRQTLITSHFLPSMHCEAYNWICFFFFSGHRTKQKQPKRSQSISGVLSASMFSGTRRHFDTNSSFRRCIVCLFFFRRLVGRLPLTPSWREVISGTCYSRIRRQ